LKDYKNDNLILLYTKYNLKITSELQRECRSLVIDRELLTTQHKTKILAYSCEVPLLNDEGMLYLNNSFKSKDDIITTCYEGTYLSIFNNNNTWYLATRRSIQKEDSDIKSLHYDMFIETIKSKGYDNFNTFCQELNPLNSYYYVLIHYNDKNIIDYSKIFGNNYMKLCLTSIKNNEMLDLDIYLNPLYSLDNNESIFISNLDSFDNLKTYSKNFIDTIDYEGIIVRRFDDSINKYRLIKLQTVPYRYIQQSKTKTGKINVYKGLVFLYQNNKLYDYFNNKNFIYSEFFNDDCNRNIINTIDMTFKCLALEFFELFKILWGFDNFEQHKNKETYTLLSKDYKQVLYNIRGLYFKHKKLNVKNIYNYLKTVETHTIVSILTYRLLLYKLFDFSKINDDEYNTKVKLCNILTNKIIKRDMFD
jgi:hypothetical protein